MMEIMNRLAVLQRESEKENIKTTAKVYTVLFMAASMIGFLHEELYHLITYHELVKRGFLFGPYLPIYGFGAVFMLICLKKPFKKHPLFVFLGSMLVAGALEYITGSVMLRLFGVRLWDYSGFVFNIDGFVCLRSLSAFAVAGLFVVYVFEPFVRRHLMKLKPQTLNLLCAVIVPTIVIDLMFTLVIKYI